MPVDKKLQAEWDRKLAESGFEDIEYPDGEFRRPERIKLPQRTPSFNVVGAEAHRRYYEVAGHIAAHESQQTVGGAVSVARKIRALHAEGLTGEQIRRQLRAPKAFVLLIVREFAKQIREEATREEEGT